MKSLRFVCWSVVLVSSTYMILLVAAQSNPVAHANQPNAIPGSHEHPTAESAQSDASGQPKILAKAVVYDSGGYAATSVALADLNGDGHLDLVVADADTGICVLLGNGDGTFQNPVVYPTIDTGPYSLALAIGDVNGDGHVDLVVSSYEDVASYEGEVNVLLGNGDGTFQPPAVYASGGGGGSSSIVIKDLNGDGRPDLILADGCQDLNCSTGFHGGVSVLMGNGDGTFQTAVTYDSGGVQAQSIALADVNGDGHPDLVVANLCESSGGCGGGVGPGGVSVLLGSGDGTFQAAVSYSSGGYNANPVAIWDINGDGRPDVIVGNACQSSSCNNGSVNGNVGVLLGNGDGTFQPPATYSSGEYGANSLALADLNGDGHPDVVAAGNMTASDSHGEVSVLLNNGNGTFQAPVSYKSSGYIATSVATGDLNDDGRPDVVILNNYSRNFGDGPGTVGVLLDVSVAKTSVSVTSSPNPSLVNQSVTFTATVTSSPAVPDGEVVTFYDGKTSLGTGTTTNGIASLTTSFSKAKMYPIKASYPGDAFHKAESSGTLKQVVNP